MRSRKLPRLYFDCARGNTPPTSAQSDNSPLSVLDLRDVTRVGRRVHTQAAGGIKYELVLACRQLPRGRADVPQTLATGRMRVLQFGSEEALEAWFLSLDAAHAALRQGGATVTAAVARMTPDAADTSGNALVRSYMHVPDCCSQPCRPWSMGRQRARAPRRRVCTACSVLAGVTDAVAQGWIKQREGWFRVWRDRWLALDGDALLVRNSQDVRTHSAPAALSGRSPMAWCAWSGSIEARLCIPAGAGSRGTALS